MLNFRQTYTISYQVIKIGDLTFKIGSIYKDMLSKLIFLELHNPYNSKYEEIKDFSYDIIQSLYDFPNTQSSCIFDSTIEKLYKEEKIKANSHWEILQYVHFIFKKH
jgi:hypothetical protein